MGAGVLGVLEWPWRESMVPCGPSPLPEHPWPWREETGAERAAGGAGAIGMCGHISRTNWSVLRGRATHRTLCPLHPDPAIALMDRVLAGKLIF